MSDYGIERYLNIRNAYAPSFNHTGEELSFLLDSTGVGQIWTLDGPKQWPEQRTYFDERVTFTSYSPERPELIFGMDQGGNERVQLFKQDTTDGTIHNLTDTPSAKHRWGGWSHTGDRFAFTSNRRDVSVFDIYVQNRSATGDEAELVYEGDGWLSITDWSPDDSRLLVSEAYSNYDQDVYVLDIDNGELDLLTPHDGDIRYQSACFAPKMYDDGSTGDGVYVITDQDHDTLYLTHLDMSTGDLTPVYDGEGWNIERIALDDETGRFVLTRNVDGYTDVITGQLTEKISFTEFPEPTIPDGVAGGISFDPDAERFAITATADTLNANVFVVDMTTGECQQWTAAPTAGIPPTTFQSGTLVHIESFDGLTIPGFYTLPETASEGTTPVIVDIHGGPESQRRPSFNTVKQYFLNNGYAYFEPNVRGSSGYGREYASLDDVRKRMDSVHDIKSCVEWLQRQPEIDPNQIVAKGGSYGGFMVLASLTEYPDLWAAGIDTVGIANFVTFLENTGDWRRSLREAEYGSLEDDREFLESISPIHYADQIQAPLFVIHGRNDPRVPVGEAEQIVTEARNHGVPVKKLIFEDEGHGISKLENRVEAYSAIVQFLNEHV